MRTTSKEHIQLFFGAMVSLVLTAFMSTSSYASIKPVHCATNFGEQSFTLDKHEIAFHDVRQEQGRSISSVIGSVTKKTHKGFNKTAYVNGNRHFIHVENETTFNSNNDFMTITTPKGHKMTYPLNCSRVQ